MTETRAQCRLRHQRDEESGDVTIQCRGRTWRVHGAILGGENDWFDNVIALAAEVSATRLLSVLQTKLMHRRLR